MHSRVGITEFYINIAVQLSEVRGLFTSARLTLCLWSGQITASAVVFIFMYFSVVVNPYRLKE